MRLNKKLRQKKLIIQRKSKNKRKKLRTIISASRRTDIPAFYLNWFKKRLNEGFIDVTNPIYKNQVSRIYIDPDSVHTIVFWSKDFGNFLKNPEDFSDYHLFFNFTINDSKKLEPKIKPLDERLHQLKELVEIYGPDHVQWRFDPIVFWQEDDVIVNNLESFEHIAHYNVSLGIDNCVFSFATWYDKCLKRAKKYNFQYYDPSLEEKIKIISGLNEISKNLGIKMYSCCGDDKLHKIPNIFQSRCINGELYSRLTGIPASKAKAIGQRLGCNCTKSRDIGDYNKQKCLHGCLYCYANPII